MLHLRSNHISRWSGGCLRRHLYCAYSAQISKFLCVPRQRQEGARIVILVQKTANALNGSESRAKSEVLSKISRDRCLRWRIIVLSLFNGAFQRAGVYRNNRSFFVWIPLMVRLLGHCCRENGMWKKLHKVFRFAAQNALCRVCGFAKQKSNFERVIDAG